MPGPLLTSFFSWLHFTRPKPLVCPLATPSPAPQAGEREFLSLTPPHCPETEKTPSYPLGRVATLAFWSLSSTSICRKRTAGKDKASASCLSPGLQLSRDRHFPDQSARGHSNTSKAAASFSPCLHPPPLPSRPHPFLLSSSPPPTRLHWAPSPQKRPELSGTEA